MSDFAGRVAIVTGAGAGLGRSHAIGLAREGAKVVVSDILAENAAAVVAEIIASGGDAQAIAADVSDLSAVEAMVAATLAQWGRLDILVNNAGILRDKSFAKLDPADFDLVLKVHLRGSYNCIRAAWPFMRDANYGRIVLTSSVSGVYGNFGQANYGAAKAGMVGLMNVLHIEGAKYDIRVNCLLPTAATAMTDGLIPDAEAALLTPETVTPAVLYLTSEKAPSRMILGAGAGVFAVTHIVESPGFFLKEGQRSVADIAAHIEQIGSMEGAAPINSAFEQSSKYVALALGGETLAKSA